MRNRMIMLLAALTLFSAGSAWGQTRSLRAHVPFEFTIGQQTFPAGDYQFQSVVGKPGHNSTHGMLLIRDLEGQGRYKVVCTKLVQASEQSESKPKLVFRNRDGHRYLSQIWEAGATVGEELPDTSRSATLVAEEETNEIIVAD
jgi:hypothetical protein